MPAPESKMFDAMHDAAAVKFSNSPERSLEEMLKEWLVLADAATPGPWVIRPTSGFDIKGQPCGISRGIL